MNQQHAKKPAAPLPASWVNKIFEKLSMTHGRDFLSRWDGFDADAMLEVKADWGMELGGFVDQPDAIAHALAHLPAKAPNVIEFRQLCLTAPQPEFKQLPRPTQDPQAVAKVMNHVKTALTQIPKRDPKQWARNIVAKAKAGKGVSPTTLKFAQEALGSELRQSLQ